MSKTVQINAKIDSETKEKAVDILHSLGMTTSQAISLFLKQIIFTKSIPFELKLPNKETIKTFKKTDTDKDLHRVSDLEELKKELIS